MHIAKVTYSCVYTLLYLQTAEQVSGVNGGLVLPPPPPLPFLEGYGTV